MELYEINAIRNAFRRCYGLQESLSKAVTQEDILLKEACLDSLSNQTGIRLDYLTQNVDIINDITKI